MSTVVLLTFFFLFLLGKGLGMAYVLTTRRSRIALASILSLVATSLLSLAAARPASADCDNANSHHYVVQVTATANTYSSCNATGIDSTIYRAVNGGITNPSSIPSLGNYNTDFSVGWIGMTFINQSPPIWLQTGYFVGTIHAAADNTCTPGICVRTTTAVRGYLEVQKSTSTMENYEILSLGVRTMGTVTNQRIERNVTAGCYDLYSPYTTLQGTFCGFPSSGRADAAGEATAKSGVFPELESTYFGDTTVTTNSTLKVKGPSNTWETWDQILGTSDGTRRFDEASATSHPYLDYQVHNYYYSFKLGG